MARPAVLGDVRRSTFSTLELTPIIKQALRVPAKAAHRRRDYVQLSYRQRRGLSERAW